MQEKLENDHLGPSSGYKNEIYETTFR